MDEPTTKTTVLGSAWRHRWFVVSMLVIGAILGLTASVARSTSYKATASLVVTSNTDAKTTGTVIDANPERYVADQVAILKLPTVTNRAAQIATEELRAQNDPTLPAEVTADEIRAAESIANVTGTNLINVSASSGNRTVARVMADSLARAYQSVRSDQSQSTGGGSVESLQAALDANQKSLADVDRQISDLRVAAGGVGVDEQYRKVLQQLNAGATGTAGSVDAAANAIDALQKVERQLPEFAPLYSRRDALLAQVTSLQSQIDNAKGQPTGSSSNVVVFSPAEEPTSAASLGKGSLAALGAIFGALGGVALSYWRDVRKREVVSSATPAAILDAPLIAEVPDLRAERLRGLLPVIEAPDSVAAEAFRFAVTSLEAALPRGVIGVVSASVGAGKTVTTANVAMAYAQSGSLVLAVDADLKAQGLVHLFPMPEETASVPGLTDVIKFEETAYAKIRLESGRDSVVDLIPGGSLEVEPAQVFGTKASAALFDAFRSDYDVTLVDVAPVLNVAYATTVLKDVDAAVVVVPHGMPLDDLERLAAKLRLFSIPLAGYIYTFAPLSEERAQESTAPIAPGGRRWSKNLPWSGPNEAVEPPVKISE